MKLLWKLLGRHIRPVQLAGFLLTGLAGMSIVLLAVQLYRDLRPVFVGSESIADNDFVILSKKVEGAGAGGTFFTSAEREEFEAQPFVEAVGAFTPARYRVTGGISLAGRGISTYLFFESVPDRFLDVRSDEWSFEPGDDTIPIVLPRNYLNLYNFGFASTQGLPQIGEDIVRGLVLDIVLSGRGLREEFRGRIVGFSDRLNTILVPESFICWSNERFADRPQTEPSRLVAEVRNAADDGFHEYLVRHGYLVEGGADAGGRIGYFLRLATTAVVGVGALITVLSFFVLLLSVSLVLQKNARKQEDLLMLGYTPARVARPYLWLVCAMNGLVVAGAVAVLVWSRSVYLPAVRSLVGEFVSPGIGRTVLVGTMIALLVAGIDCLVIRRKVKRLWSGNN